MIWLNLFLHLEKIKKLNHYANGSCGYVMDQLKKVGKSEHIEAFDIINEAKDGLANTKQLVPVKLKTNK